MKRWSFSAMMVAALAALFIGLAAAHFWDGGAMQKLTAERDLARDCRQSGASLPSCPVVYRNTKIEWRDKVETVQTPDPQQTKRVALLSGELDSAQRRIRDLEIRIYNFYRARNWNASRRGRGVYAFQNGTIEYPYYSDARCPRGSVAFYDVDFSSGTNRTRFSGDPSVCYVRTRIHDSREHLGALFPAGDQR
jgi:hypothetical protein